MTQYIHNNSQEVKAYSASCNNIVAGLFIITSVALAVIGILVALEVNGLFGFTNYWFVFEVGALGAFIFGAICCCRCCCNDKATRRHQNQEEEIRIETTRTFIVQQPHTAPVLATADQAYVAGLSAAQNKDFASAVQGYNHAWSAYGHIQAGLALAECLDQGIGVNKDPKAAQQIYVQLSRHQCMEAIFSLAEDGFKKGNASGLAWLEYATAVDDDLSRAGHLTRVLQSHEPARTSINRQTFSQPESRAMADQLNAMNTHILEESQRTAYLILATQYVLQEKAKRQTANNQLLAAS